MNETVDIAKLVKETLDEMGCGEKVGCALDSHSIICIMLNDGVEIAIENTPNGVMFSSVFGDVSKAMLDHLSAQLFRFSMENSVDYFVFGKSIISVTNEMIGIFALLSASSLDVSRFKAALGLFFRDIQLAKSILGM